jgi:hypothetical protein
MVHVYGMLYCVTRVSRERGDNMLANDMKKGQTGTLRNGSLLWRFEIADNKRGMIRLATVHGFVSEMGSIYVHDIATVDVGGKAEALELTAAQEKRAAAIRSALGGLRWI